MFNKFSMNCRRSEAGFNLDNLLTSVPHRLVAVAIYSIGTPGLLY